MQIDAILMLLLAGVFFATGLTLMRHWRMVGAVMTQTLSRQLVFGPMGEAILVPVALVAMGGGVWLAAEGLGLLVFG